MEKVAIFDVDGTLFDTREGIIQTFNEVLKKFGKDNIKEEDESIYIGPSVRTVFSQIVGLNDSDSECATALYRSIYVEKNIVKSHMYAGVIDGLKTLKQKGFVICVATMKTYRQVEKLFRMFAVEGYFEEIQTAKEDGSISKSQMLNLIKDKYGNREYYMIGDTKGDFNASKEAGMQFIAALYGYGKFDNEIEGATSFANIIELLK